MARILVDYENNAEEWWQAAREWPHPAILTLLDVGGPADIDITEEQAEDVQRWATSLPGWDGGPEFAPHPLIVERD